MIAWLIPFAVGCAPASAVAIYCAKRWGDEIILRSRADLEVALVGEAHDRAGREVVAAYERLEIAEQYWIDTQDQLAAREHDVARASATNLALDRCNDRLRSQLDQAHAELDGIRRRLARPGALLNACKRQRQPEPIMVAAGKTLPLGLAA